MDTNEAIELSQRIDTGLDHALLLNVKTDWYVLDCLDITKAEASKMVRQINGTHVGRAVYWKTYQRQHKLNQLILISDKEAATLAMLFADGHLLRKLTIGELREARNVVDIPWLPPIKGYLKIREHNKKLSTSKNTLRMTMYEMQWLGHADIVQKLSELSTLIESKERPLPF
jgi:hypothetical protein